MSREALLRSLPSVDELLSSPAAASWTEQLPRERIVAVVRAAVAKIRQDILAEEYRNGRQPTDEVTRRVTARVDRLRQPSLRRVINASGVILHTNLGRAPLGESAIDAIREIASGYSNLEYGLETGKRGKRDVHVGELLEELLGAPAIVVNNNAAAIYLVLNELSSGHEAIVSRGELIEIGDGFRIPEILERSGTRLREIGATNRTRIDDYRAAIGEDTRLLMRVHPSNFRQVGFTGKPSLEELVALSRETGVPLVEDLGSGCLTDLAAIGIADEPPVKQSLDAGVDVVTFSGDKLLGGPQAGIIVGKPALIQRIRRNPMFRALRVDKLTYAALGATLRDYLSGNHAGIPALRMMRASAAEIEARARSLAGQITVGSAGVMAGESLVGGGSTPAATLATFLVAVQPPDGSTAQSMERCLRGNAPPVVARIEDHQLIVDLRTVAQVDEPALVAALNRCG